MAAHQEVYNFVNKSMSSCKNGDNANLSLQYNHGSAVVNLQVHLRQYPPPPYHPHRPPRPSPYEHPSHSWLRQSKRREHARYEKEKVAKTNETEKDDRSSTNNEVIASAEVTELTEQVVTFNICAVKAAEKVAIGNADDVPAEQAVPGEPELKQTPIKQSDDEATIHVKQSDNETFQNSNTDEKLPSVVYVYKKVRLLLKKYHPLSIH